MALTQQKLRELVYMALFCASFCDEIPEDLTSVVMRQSLVSKTNAKRACDRAREIFEKRGDIEGKIASVSKEYTLERIPKAELAALQLSLFELFYDEAIPPKVAMAEGIRIARKYATPSAGQFVNAILDQLYQENQVAAEGV